mmetsp:Transcript_12367/g.27482  ORF Transcript_12367/g.27482 Transcript_12367/m.27482 type:complete len:437 (-) Transcript_12367:29-1339(-)
MPTLCHVSSRVVRRLATRSYASGGLHTFGRSALTRPIVRVDCRVVNIPIRHFSDGHGHSHGHSHGHGHNASSVLGHAHDHSESHALELAQLKGEAYRITAFGFGFNAVIGAIQVYVGLACSSAGLLSDGTHTIADSGSDIVTLLALRFMQTAPKSLWPYGPGKIDSIAALGVGGVLFTSGGIALMHSLQMLFEVPGVSSIPGLSSFLDAGGHEHGHVHSDSEHQGHGSSHGHGHGGALNEEGFAGKLALGTCMLTIGGKELLYRMTASIAERTGSSLLMANALHHRSDALCSLVVIAGLLGRMFVHAAFDPLAGSLVAGYVIQMSFGISSRAIRELLDRQLPSSTREELRTCLDEVIASWPLDSSWEAWHTRGTHLEGVSGRRAGPETHLLVELSLTNASWAAVSAEAVSALEQHLKIELLQRGQRGIADVRILQR